MLNTQETLGLHGHTLARMRTNNLLGTFSKFSKVLVVPYRQNQPFVFIKVLQKELKNINQPSYGRY
jgi:hypothetical protein